jgi:cephalosporin-C deacetylase-like acetyl esterase
MPRLIAVLILIAPLLAIAQVEPAALQPVLAKELQSPEVAAQPLLDYLMTKVPPLNVPAKPELWTAEADRLRKLVLDKVIFHGWPAGWRDAPARFEDLGVFYSAPGYRMRKLRFEVVPGFRSVAVLYEPVKADVKAPGIVNVNGHVGALGKAVEYKQKRCINQALHGIYALNLEWIGQGELSDPQNEHTFAAHMDLAGATGVGLFYLSMRKGLDYLAAHPKVDPTRLGVTGLSGGGWQTITLSSLDERVRLGIPVAGYSPMTSRIERFMDIGDNEQQASDLFVYADFTHLTAMRAPRPTLLIYNAQDSCCFIGPMVKPELYDKVAPIFALYNGLDNFAWHENMDPGDHNYQLDNREASYRFTARHFGLPAWGHETPVGGEVKSYDELKVGLGEGQSTILGLARKLAASIERPAGTAVARRVLLQEIVRYRPVSLDHAWVLANSKAKGVETRSYRLRMTNGLSATATWAVAYEVPSAKTATIVLNDKGRAHSAAIVADRANRGEQVLALDLLFTGDAAPRRQRSGGDDGRWLYGLLLSATGERPIGVEAAQLIAAARHFQRTSGAEAIRIEATGMRSQLAALVAGALAPKLFAEISVHDGLRSLGELLERPVKFQEAPDMFCRDLYKYFDLDTLGRLAELRSER